MRPTADQIERAERSGQPEPVTELAESELAFVAGGEGVMIDPNGAPRRGTII